MQTAGRCSRREMRLAEEDEDERVGMPVAYFGNLVGGVAVAGSDIAQVFARHAIESVDRARPHRGRQRAVRKMGPSRIPSQGRSGCAGGVRLVNLSAQPLVENVLVAGKNRFHSEHERALVQSRVPQERSKIALRVGQGVVVADQARMPASAISSADLVGGEDFLDRNGRHRENHEGICDRRRDHWREFHAPRWQARAVGRRCAAIVGFPSLPFLSNRFRSKSKL